jgi:hypothetical protein
MVLGVAALAGCDVHLTDFGDCDNPRDFIDEIGASGLTALIADAEPGNLRVVGRSGINTVRVRARACASNRSTRDEIDFDLFQSDGAARLISYVPSYDYAWLDLVVEVPIDFDVDVYHQEGDLEVEDVYSVWISDTSGHIDVFDIDTDVIVDEDGSGDIDVSNIGGDLVVRYDRSGRITYRNIGGGVFLP